MIVYKSSPLPSASRCSFLIQKPTDNKVRAISQETHTWKVQIRLRMRYLAHLLSTFTTLSSSLSLLLSPHGSASSSTPHSSESLPSESPYPWSHDLWGVWKHTSLLPMNNRSADSVILPGGEKKLKALCLVSL